METKPIDSKQEKKRVLFTRGNKKVSFSHVGTTVVGSAIGATISRIIPIDTARDSKPTPEPTPEPKPTPEPTPNPKPTPEPTNSPEPTPTPEPSPDPVAKSEPTQEPSVENPHQEEIDEIAEALVRDTKIDARDAAEVDGLLHFTDRVTINLPNGLEADGFVFNLGGEDLVLADLDGDGVYDNVLAHVDGVLTDVEIPLIGDDGMIVTTLNQFIAQHRLTESDVEQIVNATGGDVNLTITDIERRQIEADDAHNDIHGTDREDGATPETDKGDTAQLSPEEEKTLLDDILGRNDNPVQGQPAPLSPEEIEILRKSILGGDVSQNDLTQLSSEDIETLQNSVYGENDDLGFFDTQQTDDVYGGDEDILFDMDGLV
ncbi:MAG: hypothetical protein IJK87_08845 [Prevotella sp.]|nr:hypothetical protein [Prevotella sp.]